MRNRRLDNTLIYTVTILFVLYYILNIIFPTNYYDISDNSHRIYPQIVMAVLSMVLIITFFVKIRSIIKNSFFIPYIILLLLAALYIFYPLELKDNLLYFLRSYMGIVSLFAMYALYLASPKKMSRSIFVIYIFEILFCLAALIQDKMDFAAGNSISELFDSNAAFLLTSCIPLSLLIPKKRMRVYVYFLLVAACLYSGQRSSSLCAVMSLPFAAFILKDSVKRTDVLILCLLLVLLTPMIINSVDNLIARNRLDIERGNMGSGRMEFWGIVIQGYLDGNILQVFFGNGTNSVKHLIEDKYGLAIGAHNGWLDILYTFGIVGIIPYTIMIFQFLTSSRKYGRRVRHGNLIFILMFIIYFIKTSTSHGYPDVSMIPFFSACAILCAENKINRKLNIINTTVPLK